MSAPNEFEAASCTGKVTFASYGAASRIQKRRGRDRQYSKGEAYRCRVCRGWHIGSKKEPERPNGAWQRWRTRYDEATS